MITRLIKGVTPLNGDSDVVAVIESLPPTPEGVIRDRIYSAILNEDGVPYREVQHATVLEAMHFAARMNTLGFMRLDRAELGPSRRYGAVFQKRPAPERVPRRS